MREIEILGNFKVRFALNWAIFEKIWQKEPRVRFANARNWILGNFKVRFAQI